MKHSLYFLLLLSAISCKTDEVDVPMPSAPTNLSAELISGTQVDLTWTDNATNETGYKIERKKPGDQYSNIGTVNTDITFYSDIGLTIGETYTYRVYAFNDGGNSATYSNEVTIKAESVPILITREVTSITTISAVSGGEILNDGSLTLIARGVCWSTSQPPTISDTKTADGTGTGSFASSLSLLFPGTTYYVRAYATNSKGTGYGNTISFTTNDIVYSSFTDTRDGNYYNTVTIGTQVWMKENLRYLPSVVGPNTGSQTTPYYYVYDYDGTNVTDAKAKSHYNTDGVLYNWPAAMNGYESSTANPSGVQGVCPTDWHLPSDAEWTKLENYLADNGYNYDGTTGGGRAKIAKSFASTSGWLSSSNTGAVGNTDYSSYRNKSGFQALAGGARYNVGTFYGKGIRSRWWSATVGGATGAYARGLEYHDDHVSSGNQNRELGHSVRCIRD